MKVSKISKKLIKPHTPTPPNLKNYYLSFIDRCIPPTNMISFALFYESKPKTMMQLEESLARILVQFYPLAGRYTKNDPFVDCSDQGVEFIEAESSDVERATDLIEKNMEIQKLNNLFPDIYFSSDAPNPLLSIQVTHFPSGGLAIAIAVSHKVFDASSLDTFVAAWSNATNPDGKLVFTPSFDLPSLLPCKDGDFSNNEDSSTNNEDSSTNNDQNIVAKRFLFDNVALARLKSELGPNRNGKTISRVRAVSAVIAKTIIGLDRVKHGETRDFVISQPINMRERTTTPSSKHACGNLIIPSITPRMAASEGKEIGMQELVDLIGDAVVKSIVDHAEILSPDRGGHEINVSIRDNYIKQLSNPNTNIMGFNDWSKFGFYEADFGWGKPVWVSIGPQSLTNVAVLLSNKDGDGIEAWMYLKQDDMHYFEQAKEIKYFTT